MMSSLRYHSDEKYGNSKGRVKKIVENSSKGWGGSATADFLLRKKEQKKHVLKTLDFA